MTRDLNEPVLLKAWERLARAAREPGQPRLMFDAFSGICDQLFGHSLLTILAWHPEANDTQRIFSTRPVEYPVGARKPMGVTVWGDLLLKQGRSWIGATPDDIRWAFFDHELIERMGCGACLSVPVRWDGVTLAAVSMLGPDGAYRPSQLESLELISSLMVPGLLTTDGIKDG